MDDDQEFASQSPSAPLHPSKIAEHTPGPWHRNIPPASKYSTVWSGRNKHVAHIVAGAPRRSGSAETMSEAEQEANINLIAAAPDLLAALRALEPFVDATTSDECLAACDLAGAAIAKATGARHDT